MNQSASPHSKVSPSPAAAAVSIVLPTYNRARFLRRAIDSIASQTFRDWELIVVDDGSTDETPALVPELLAAMRQPNRFVRQENGGPYAARNTGLALATGQYVAFYDSDDIWDPDYLSSCMAAALTNPQVDWIYCACRMVDETTGREIAPSTFYRGGVPQPFLRLTTRRAGELRIIDDPDTLARAALNGLYCGLQNSVIKRAILLPFRTEFRNEGEDVLAALRALAAGRQFGYIDRPLVQYTVHEGNSSGSALVTSPERRLRLSRAYALGWDEVARELGRHPRGGRAIRRAAARAWFWNLGYAAQWQDGARAEALRSYRRALSIWPWDLRFWKTYVAALLRYAWTRQPRVGG